ncbi:hypothetical protein GBA65_15630 [Rubrobacter marinus]|uniref:DNA topoisomerase n=1 Tax=Rubrobacter marinus TaxID=2653852 RepID=A0A6G8PZU3_9ACTN|nr:hypothetical protein GBA65_15630 [Rubrobacter marinus]
MRARGRRRIVPYTPRMRLVVAEKPSVARDIASVLGRHRKEKGALVGEGWTVTWALGHLAELAPPDAYGEEYKRWRLESLPVLPERFKVKVNAKTRDQFAVVKGLMRSAGVAEVVNACDAGREGELIFSYLYELSGCEKPVRRLWISSLTSDAIRQGFASLRDGRSMKPLESAARSRGEADWIVGMNATRAYSTKFGRPGNVLSVGRVQTPTLKLLVDREREIEDFRPEKFWTVYARFARDGASYDGVWFKDKQHRLEEQEAAEAIARKVKGGTGTVRKAEKKTASERPPLLHDLTELQRNANSRYGFTAERTLRAAQALYEERKLVTYPRTSSRYLTHDMVAGLGRRVEAAGALPDLAPFAEGLLALPKLPVSKRVVDDAKVTDHHAIVPTNKKPSGELPPDEAKVYDLVARRFLAVFFPAARFENTTVVTEVREETFLSRGRVVLEAGWRALYPDGVSGRKEKEPPVLPRWSGAGVGRLEGRRQGGGDQAAAPVLGGRAARGDGDRRQARRGRGAPPGDEGLRARHAGHEGVDDREAPQGRVPRARGEGPRADGEGARPDPPSGRQPPGLPGAHGLLGGAPRPHGARRRASPRLHAGHKGPRRLARRGGARQGGREGRRPREARRREARPRPQRLRRERRAPRYLPEVWLPGRREPEGLRVLGVEDGLLVRDLEDGLRQEDKRRPGETTPPEGAHREAQGLQEQGRQALLSRPRPGRGSQGQAGLRGGGERLIRGRGRRRLPPPKAQEMRRRAAHPRRPEPSRSSAAGSTRDGPPVAASCCCPEASVPPVTVTVPTMPWSSCGPQKYE